MARMAPVFGWMITTVHCLASVLFTSASHACCAASCSAGMIVSRMPVPFCAGVSLLPASGIGWPSAPISTCSLPGVPDSSLLYSCSRPVCPAITPVAGFTFVKPTTFAVASPSG